MTDFSTNGAVVLRRPRNLLGQLLSWLIERNDREVRLTRRYQRMMAGGNRDTPAIVLKDGSQHDIVSPPSRMDPHWELDGGRRVTTDEIVELGTARFMAGYS